MNHVRSLVCLLALATTLAAQDSRPASRPDTRPRPRPGTQALHLKVEGRERSAWLHVPAACTGREALPLVMVLHGAGGSGRHYLERNRFRDEAERRGWLIVAPDGLPARPQAKAGFLTNPVVWNSGQLRAGSERARIDDVAFLLAVLDECARRAPVDQERVFVTGHSNGAGMTYLLAQRASERFAAFAPVMGLNPVAAPAPAHARPFLAIYGREDPLVPFEGGESELPWGSRTTPPVRSMVEPWRTALGCGGEPRESTDVGGVRREVYGPGANRATFTLIVLAGHGHGWPGGQESGLPERMIGRRSEALDATTTILDFFARHRR